MFPPVTLTPVNSEKADKNQRFKLNKEKNGISRI
jgi:hypothetical protein